MLFSVCVYHFRCSATHGSIQHTCLFGAWACALARARAFFFFIAVVFCGCVCNFSAVLMYFCLSVLHMCLSLGWHCYFHIALFFVLWCVHQIVVHVSLLALFFATAKCWLWRVWVGEGLGEGSIERNIERYARPSFYVHFWGCIASFVLFWSAWCPHLDVCSFTMCMCLQLKLSCVVVLVIITGTHLTHGMLSGWNLKLVCTVIQTSLRCVNTCNVIC